MTVRKKQRDAYVVGWVLVAAIVFFLWVAAMFFGLTDRILEATTGQWPPYIALLIAVCAGSTIFFTMSNLRLPVEVRVLTVLLSLVLISLLISFYARFHILTWGLLGVLCIETAAIKMWQSRKSRAG